MRALNSVKRCPKCGYKPHEDNPFKMHYHYTGHDCGCFDFDCDEPFREDEEHLARPCPDCKYQWAEECAS